MAATGAVAPKARAPPKKAAFDRNLFERWLRMLLVAFYSDEEVVVTDLLLRRCALVRDTDIASAVRLTDKQVRSVLEQRLVPDGIVERISEDQGKRSTLYYRISHVVVAVTAKRLQNVEDSMAAKQVAAKGDGVPEYRCPLCRRLYDSMQAMLLQGGSGGVFQCEECHTELEAVEEDVAALWHERLQRFRQQCQKLLLLTRELKDMQVPLFEREAPQRRQQEEVGRREEAAVVSAPGAKPAAKRAPLLPLALPQPQPEALPAPTPAGVEAKPAVEDAQKRLRDEMARRLRAGFDPAAARCGKARAEADAAPMQLSCAGGKRYRLDELRGDGELLANLTDEEYERWFAMERAALRARHAVYGLQRSDAATRSAGGADGGRVAFCARRQPQQRQQQLCWQELEEEERERQRQMRRPRHEVEPQELQQKLPSR